MGSAIFQLMNLFLVRRFFNGDPTHDQEGMLSEDERLIGDFPLLLDRCQGVKGRDDAKDTHRDQTPRREQVRERLDGLQEGLETVEELFDVFKTALDVFKTALKAARRLVGAISIGLGLWLSCPGGTYCAWRRRKIWSRCGFILACLGAGMYLGLAPFNWG